MSGGSPWDVLAESVARVPPGGSPLAALPELLSALVRATGARSASVWARSGERLVHVVRWPDQPTGGEAVAVGDLAGLPGVGAVVPIMDGDVTRGAVTLCVDDAADVGADDRDRLRDTAAAAVLLLRGPQLAAALNRRIAQADQLAGQLVASRQRLASTEELERRRMVTEIVAVSGQHLDGLRHRLGVLSTAVVSGSGRTESLQELRSELDELIDHVRVVARGIYPNVLKDRGPRPALEELAADLPRPVRFEGAPGDRAPWELESGLYWAIAAALRAVAAGRSDRLVVVRFARPPGGIEVTLHEPGGSVQAQAWVREAVEGATDRLAALGGMIELTVGADGLTVRARVPDRLLPVLPAP